MSVGVLAHIHGGQVQPEHRDRALDPSQQAVGDQLAGVGPQRVADQRQLGDQLALAEIVPAGVWGRPASMRRRVFAIFPFMHVSLSR